MSLFNEWIKVCRCSPKAGFCNLLSLPYGYSKYKNRFTYKGVLLEDNAVKDYIRKKYKDIVMLYRLSTAGERIKNRGDKLLFMFWWQGLDNAIPLIKGSIDSAKIAFPDFKLVVITEKNYKDYIELPQYILDKHKNGEITTTELADISRVTLLAKYGGIWSDISMYYNPPVFDFYDLPIFTMRKDTNRVSYLPSKDMWSSFFLYSRDKDNPFFSFARDIFFAYWKENRTLIDYFFIDYIWWVAYEEFDQVKQDIDAVPYQNPDIYKLQPLLNLEYNQATFDEICKTSWAFKLRRQDQYIAKKDCEYTFYGKLFNDFIE